MSDLRLLVVASDPLARTGVSTMISGRAGYRIVGQIESGESLPAEIDVYQPHIIVWDLGWDPDEGLAWLQDLSPEFREGGTGLVVLVNDGGSAVAAWSAGARGLLFRDTSGERLLAAISAVADGLAVVDPDLMESMVPPRPLAESTLVEELTPREVEVLQLLAEGLANRAIAQRLDISEHTVKFHVNAIMSKLGAQSRTDAVVRATRMGLVIL
jgi:DNA-binding NarL/FixJ family response regulator